MYLFSRFCRLAGQGQRRMPARGQANGIAHQHLGYLRPVRPVSGQFEPPQSLHPGFAGFPSAPSVWFEPGYGVFAYAEPNARQLFGSAFQAIPSPLVGAHHADWSCSKWFCSLTARKTPSLVRLARLLQAGPCLNPQLSLRRSCRWALPSCTIG